MRIAAKRPMECAVGVSLKFSRLFYGRWRLFGRKICDLSNGRQACVALSWARQGAAPLIHGGVIDVAERTFVR
jgi:hypothetical protein